MSKEDNLNQNWKHDFPVKKEQSLQISRRDFAKFLVEEGIDSISFNPDALIKGIENILNAERSVTMNR